MRKIGFIGSYDKTDLILYIAKILTVFKNKVLVIDATENQKAKYIIPSINPTFKYITEFEEIDIAIGFETLEDIMKYLGITKEEDIEYDIVLVNTDNSKGIINYKIQEAEKKYFVTSFDVYGLKKSVESLRDVEENLMAKKVYFTNEMSQENDEYFNFLFKEYKINWSNEIIYFPLDTEDLEAIYENQKVEKIKFKRLSIPYKESLAVITSEILNDVNGVQVRKAIKIIEKGA